MLNYARQRVIEALSIPHTAVLATSGPAGVQANEFPCAAVDLALYLLVPRTSDHLYNLEQNPTVSLLAAEWELKGAAQMVIPGAPGPDRDLLREIETRLAGSHGAQAEWYVLVRVDPRQVHIRGEAAQSRWGNIETIDL